MAVTVRMYDVGFGDCILISVPGKDRDWRMLVDCGVHSHGHGPHELEEVVGDVISEAGSDGPARLDVVVATHRHQDHVSGFADERWSRVEVGEVWLPWTEGPDADAQSMRRELDDAARSLLLRLGADGGPAAAMALNSSTNAAAMHTLLDGFAGSPQRRFLSADDVPLDLPGLPSGRAHVLGPPGDRAALTRMNPPRDQRWFVPPDPMAGAHRALFDLGFAVSPDAYEQRYPELALTVKERKRLDVDAAGDDGLAAASWLDRCVNNTSVFLALEIGTRVMLLAGDAQWGPWQAALAEERTLRLIERAALYKVSHHGSHNGTPRRVVDEHLAHDVLSMVSVFPVPSWPDIPKSTLTGALAHGARVLARTDHDTVPHPVRREETGLWIETTLDD